MKKKTKKQHLNKCFPFQFSPLDSKINLVLNTNDAAAHFMPQKCSTGSDYLNRNWQKSSARILRGTDRIVRLGSEEELTEVFGEEFERNWKKYSARNSRWTDRNVRQDNSRVIDRNFWPGSEEELTEIFGQQIKRSDRNIWLGNQKELAR